MFLLLLSLFALSALLPAGKIKEVAVGADPGEGTVADLLVGKVLSGVLVRVHHHVVHSDGAAQRNHT